MEVKHFPVLYFNKILYFLVLCDHERIPEKTDKLNYLVKPASLVQKTSTFKLFSFCVTFLLLSMTISFGAYISNTSIHFETTVCGKIESLQYVDLFVAVENYKCKYMLESVKND